MKTCLVTGGAGFIGSHLIERALADGHRVIAVDDESTGARGNLSAVANHPRFEYVAGDVADRELMAGVVDRADVIYHLAAAVGVALVAKDPIACIERNVEPTRFLLSRATERIREGKDVRFFLASTSEAYGKNPKPIWSEDDDLVFGPTTRSRWSYGASKAIDEFLALGHFRQHGLPAVIGRFFNVVGPRQSGAYGMVLPRFVDAALAGNPLVVHDDGQQVRCFSHVHDVIRAVVGLTENASAAGRVFNIGSDRPVSILKLARRVIAATGSSSTVSFQSYSDAYDADFEDVRRRVPDLTRLKQTIGWEPSFDLDRIIRDVIAWRKTLRSGEPA